MLSILTTKSCRCSFAFLLLSNRLPHRIFPPVRLRLTRGLRGDTHNMRVASLQCNVPLDSGKPRQRLDGVERVLACRTVELVTLCLAEGVMML